MKKWVFRSLLIMTLAATTIFFIYGAGTTLAAGNWWDKLGKPEYGGTMTFAVNNTPDSIDTYSFWGTDYCFMYEPMFFPDWTVDREEWAMQSLFVPQKYFANHLAESWEMADPQTAIVKLRKGIRWQNKPPVNGREFTAEDVEFHYDRIMGTGHGYTQPAPIAGMMLGNWEKVRALDKYTVEYKFKKPCAGVAFYSMSDQAAMNWFEAPEFVALGGPPQPPAPKGGDKKGGPPMAPGLGSGGPLQDWHNAVATGPWILADLVAGSSVTFDKNPDYWMNDPRYPENKTPYADSVRLLAIQDASTKLAALRTGKIDMLGGFGMGGAEVGWQQAKALENTDIQLKQMGLGSAPGVAFRNDKKPFTDIRVRKALNMAINREDITKSLYGGTVPGIPTGMVAQGLKGYCYEYKDWPQELKDDYAYNPEKAKQLLADAGY
ncbi:MAG: ABC transporter substrate-binding protein, partial [Candidatus Hodarchaeota archaeon]